MLPKKTAPTGAIEPATGTKAWRADHAGCAERPKHGVPNQNSKCKVLPCFTMFVRTSTHIHNVMPKVTLYFENWADLLHKTFQQWFMSDFAEDAKVTTSERTSPN